LSCGVRGALEQNTSLRFETSASSLVRVCARRMNMWGTPQKNVSFSPARRRSTGRLEYLGTG
jgi:hypothetical protein